MCSESWRPEACKFFKKEVFSCEYCETPQNTSFYRPPLVAASADCRGFRQNFISCLYFIYSSFFIFISSILYFSLLFYLFFTFYSYSLLFLFYLFFIIYSFFFLFILYFIFFMRFSMNFVKFFRIPFNRACPDNCFYIWTQYENRWLGKIPFPSGFYPI